MKVDAPPNLRDDRMSDCRSIGSNYYPSSQSRKISIGVMVDSAVKKRSGPAKEDKAAAASAERVNLNLEKSKEGKNKGQGITAPVKGKTTDSPEQKSSPWITPRSPYQAPFPETRSLAEQPATIGRQKKLNGHINAPATYSVQFFANKTSILQSGDGKQKNFSGVTYKRKGVKDGTTERMEEFTFAAAQEVHMSDKEMTEGKANELGNKTDTLRMKLWEILGNVSSPKEHVSNSWRHEVGINSIKTGQKFDQKGATAVGPRQNSDTIETDSEDSEQCSQRPVTRSLTQKRMPPKVQSKVTKCNPSSSNLQKHQEKKKNFSYDERWFGRVNGAVNGDSSKLHSRKNIKKKSATIKPRKIFFTQEDIADEIQDASYRCEATVPAERTSSLGNKMDDIRHCIPEKERESLGLDKEIQEQNLNQSLLTEKTDQQEDFNSPANGDQQDIANPSLENVAHLQDNFQSPTFGIKTPNSTSTPTSTPKRDQLVHDSPASTPKTDPLVHGVSNPTSAERMLPVKNIRSFRALQTSKADCYLSNVQTVFFGDEEELKNSPSLEPVVDNQEKDIEDGVSASSAEESDCESSEEGSPIIEAYTGCRVEDTLSSGPGSAEKPEFMLHSTKRLRTCEGIRFDNISPTSASPKGTGESNWIQEPSDQSQEDGLLRALKLFALGLQNLQSKMKSETTKKSSEILMSTADGIYLQLQNLESHIQTDVVKLKSHSKSKRKRFEANFEEQQHELKLIHEKFKEDINRHLQDCRSTMEGLEAHHIELKETVEKRKAFHRKLLLQVEEAVESQFNDAKRRITAINESARGKMRQLKHVISLCLKDGILS